MATSYSGSRSKPAYSALGAGLSEETRKTLNAAFDSLSDWRNDIASATDRNSAIVFERMAAAAKAMGWPADFVDMTRQQLQQTSKMQLQMMDQVMDIWEQQMKNPGAPLPKFEIPTGMFPSFPGGFAGLGGAQSFPGFDFGTMPTNPMQFWMQAAEMWQKSWQNAFASWMEMQRSALDRSKGR
jgi:hypothetical protein